MSTSPWHPELVSKGVWSVADNQGRHLRRHYFTLDSAQHRADEENQSHEIRRTA